MRKLLLVPLALVLLARSASAAPLAVPEQGPDVPTQTQPGAHVQVFTNERYNFEEGVHHSSFVVPAGDWTRIYLQFDGHTDCSTMDENGQYPDCDPYDRLFGVSIAGAEVLRGTTPRTTFTLRKEITPFASLLASGATVDMGLLLGTYLGTQYGSVSLDFYTESSPLIGPPAGEVVSPFAFGSLNGSGTRLTTSTTFVDAPVARATAQITLSGHGPEEFWYTGPAQGSPDPLPRLIHVLVDGHEVATAVPMPYVYALAGLSGPAGNRYHPILWWTAQQALDIAGVHTGVGEIPPYKATLDTADLDLLRGARTVEVVQEGGADRWITSLSFLLDR